MPTNKGSRDGDTGAIGIGTMIVFIAMVIVAAVAAAVLINTSGNLQRKAQDTGSETEEEVSGNIFVRDIVGNVSENESVTKRIAKVDYYLSLAPGAEPVDLQETVVRWDHGSNFTDLQEDEDGDDSFKYLSDGFEVVDVYDAGDGDKFVLDEGDRVKVRLHLGSIPKGHQVGEQVETRNETSTLIIPEEGTPVNADWTAPDTFGGQSHINLD